jgi:hypothetical protein
MAMPGIFSRTITPVRGRIVPVKTAWPARLCFALVLWNGRDAILKERLFGLTGGEGNHGEDVKEYYSVLSGTDFWRRS